jgi:hypothetical protein
MLLCSVSVVADCQVDCQAERQATQIPKKLTLMFLVLASADRASRSRARRAEKRRALRTIGSVSN